MDGTTVNPSAGGAGAAVSQGDANSGGIDYGTTSDDQILDIESGDGGTGDAGQGDDDGLLDLETGDAEGATDDAGKGNEDGGETDDDDELAELIGDEDEGGTDKKAKGGDEQLPDANQDPAELRQVFKQHPELRQSYYSDKAYRETFPTVAEARKYKELAPTVESLETAVGNAEQLEQLDTLFYSEDPKDQAQFIRTLREEDASAFNNLARALPDTLFELDQSLYREAIATPVMRAVLANVAARAQTLGLGKDGRGQNLMNAVDLISMALFEGKRLNQLQDSQAMTPRERELMAENARLKGRDAEAEKGAFQQFHEAANEKAVTAVVSLIKRAIDPLLKGTAFANRPKAVQRMIGDTYNRVDAIMKADKDLTKRVRTALMNKEGKRDAAHQKQVARVLVAYANKRMLPVAKQVVSEWTNDLLGENTRRIASQRTAQARVDVTGGGMGAGTRAAGKAQGNKVSSKDIDYSRTSDDDILNNRAFRRK